MDDVASQLEEIPQDLDIVGPALNNQWSDDIMTLLNEEQWYIYSVVFLIVV